MLMALGTFPVIATYSKPEDTNVLNKKIRGVEEGTACDRRLSSGNLPRSITEPQ